MPMRFWFVTEKNVPQETGRLLSEACEERGFAFETVVARRFDFDPAHRPAAGDMLYRGAVSAASLRVELFLYSQGVATFYADRRGPFMQPVTPPLLYAHAGVPTPRTVSVSCSDADLLRTLVERVGGFPVVLKVLGRSSGVGVMRLEGMPSLRSVLDYALSQGQSPLLCEYVPDALHWRLIVVGDEIVAHYRNRQRLDDFRSDGSDDPADFEAPVPEGVAEAARMAVRAEGLEHAGVDVLEAPSGRAYVLEANFPCYYAQAQLVAGVGVAGRMVEHLASKAARLVRCSSGHG